MNLAVDRLSFKAQPGRVRGFLGPNGAGKTTTLRMLLGLRLPTSVSTAVQGRPYRQLDDPITVVGTVARGVAALVWALYTVRFAALAAPFTARRDI